MEVRKRGGGRDAAEEFKKWGPLVKGEDGKGSGREGVEVLVCMGVEWGKYRMHEATVVPKWEWKETLFSLPVLVARWIRG